MIDAKRLVFAEPNVVRLESFSFELTPADSEVLIRTLSSVISAGTELACLSGTEDWATLPFHPGYGSVGEVIAVGKDVKGVGVGHVVFTYGNHASHGKTKVIAVEIPEGLDPVHAAFARMANVAMTALRVSDAELGDKVAVIGMGSVGNLAGQIFGLAGCDVMGIDLVARRLEIAKACGIEVTVNPKDENPVETMKEWTDGKGCEVVVEASGSPQAALLASNLAGKKGEVILLGTPRRPMEANVTELLRRVHLWQYGCVTLKGAHEWRYPVSDDAQGFTKHTIERNARMVLCFIAQKRLKVAPLLSHVFLPERCAEAYKGLRENPNEFIGVAFDWRL